jgi:AhpD family alkylhydroperoxidase
MSETTTIPETIRPMKAAAWMDRAWPEGGNAFSEFAAFVEKKGALEPKTRALILLVATSLQRCPHCVDHHLETLKKLGATNSEIAEAMMLGSVAAAGANMAWTAEVFHKRLFH